ncbi:MAG: nucleoside kinase, partial [Caldilineae bacterium]
AIFGAGFCVPGNVEPCVERRYFGAVHYLALVCVENELRRRLLARPAWRESGGETFIQQQIAFNHWLQSEGPQQAPPVALLDATEAGVEETTLAVARWMARRVGDA